MKTPLLLLPLLALSLSSSPHAAPPDITAQDSINTFACRFYAQLRTQKGNLFFSPLSISYALAVAGAGARGDTATQMEQVLHMSLSTERGAQAFAELMQGLNAAQKDEQARMEMANALWPSETFSMRPEYVDAAKKYYNTAIVPVDYQHSHAAVAHINAWVQKETRNRIPKLLGPDAVSRNTRLVLVNTVYFNARWLSPFKPHATKPELFHAPNKKATVPFMSQLGVYKYGEVNNVQIVELPYRGGAFSMLVLLPAKKPGALEKLEKAFSPKQLAAWSGALTQQKVRVSLPKFKLNWGPSPLNEMLIALGCRMLFQQNGLILEA